MSDSPMGGVSAQSWQGPTAAGSGGGLRRVLVEMRVGKGQSHTAFAAAASMNVSGFQLDNSYAPVPITQHPGAAAAAAASSSDCVIVRGAIDPSKIPDLERDPNVIKVWLDTPIAPFAFEEPRKGTRHPTVQPAAAAAPCPIGTCDCSPDVAKGTIADVARYLGVDQLWSSGIQGQGIVVGIVDGGITAVGRPIKAGEPGTAPVARVIDGYPVADWGTTAAAWGNHGNMTSTDVLGMAPQAQIYDIRISDGDAVSNALAGFQWAIDRHKHDGTPHVLSNSWGIFQESWDTAYARDPNHPFTRKVVEAIDEGILVLFAAGNCGGTCPDGRCGPDTGPGRDIWGANGHPRVITVGAVNKNEQFVGYSSQGPAALDPQKPDFCSITHFQGYFASDSGTSAATPIAAGVVALLKQGKGDATQDQVKQALKSSAKDIGPAGFDAISGAGILRGRAAFDALVRPRVASSPVVSWGNNRLDVFVEGTDAGLYHKWWNGSAWGPSVTDYENMSGKLLDAPEVVSWGDNRLDAFVVGTDSALYHKWWDGHAWGPSVTGYENLGGTLLSAPKAISWGANRLDVFVVGTDSALYHKWWGGAWGPSVTGYENMGGKVLGQPEVASWGPNRLDVFVVGTDLALYHKWWDGNAWGPSLTGYENMGGKILGHPRAVAWGPGRLDLFVVGTDSALYHKWWSGAWGPSVTGYENLGGKILGNPEVVAWGDNRLDVFVVGTDSALYHKWWDGNQWGPSVTGYESLGGTIVGQPRVVSWAPNRLDVFAIGTDSALYHKWWDGNQWGPSVTGWERLGGIVIKF